MEVRKRAGFAIVLVAALAGLVFLLGASLVAITHLQTASASYDQRVRLAKEHARASLDMAIAELQDKLGKDTSISYQADVFRADNAGGSVDDFKTPTDPLSVPQPFWTAAYDKNGNTSWLVTKPIESDFNGTEDGSYADPLIDFGGSSIVLLGDGSVGKENASLDVEVPKESIQIDGIDGYRDPKTIGHYAYWIGDLGTKASYALYDKSSQVNHDTYEGSEEGLYRRQRLKQLRASKPTIDLVNTDNETNPGRIDSFVNNFQFSDRFGNSDDGPEYYLVGLSKNDVENYFHDFTPLSKGLLVNTAEGGFRKDLSSPTSVGYGGYDSRFESYASLGKSAIATSTDYDSTTFSVKGEGFKIAPVITQFNLNYSVYLSEYSEGKQQLYITFAAIVELWNPFSSTIDLGARELVFEVDGLPDLSVWIETETTPSTRIFSKNLSDLEKKASFKVSKLSRSANKLRPGQISVYSGPKAADAAGGAQYLLSFGLKQIDGVNRYSDRVEWKGEAVSLDSAATYLALYFGDGEDVQQTPSIAVKVYEQSEDDEGSKTRVLLDTYRLYDGSWSGEIEPAEVAFSVPKLEYADTNITDVGIPRFGFGWKISDEAIYYNSDYDPLKPKLLISQLEDFSGLSNAEANTLPVFYPSESDLLAVNLTEYDADRSLDAIYDISVLQLPKQELTSISQLSGAIRHNQNASGIGNPSDPNNKYLDRYTFSTISTNMDTGSVLPNAGYMASDGLMEMPSSASDIFVHGMFNVNSTSIDAWASILKGCPIASSDYWNSKIETGDYLFFNNPLAGEDTFRPLPVSLPSKDSTEAFRWSYKTNVIALTEIQVDRLAKFLVSEIRTYIRDKEHPFLSLEEFVDSGVLQRSINANYSEEEGGDERLNPAWVVDGSPAQLRQSTIFNLIGPYLSARSDTFLIRAYGDATDPADSGKIWARAYCEAILQRVHEPYSNDPDAAENFNRTFKVVAFRWLSPAEI